MNPAAPDRYGVVGNPVAHSKSPLIHALFAEQTHERLTYERVLAPLSGFRETVAAFMAQGGKGLNVTLPFKLEAHALATQTTERARVAGAVNTLRFDAGVILGDNTDGAGLMADLERLGHLHGFAMQDARVLLLGAGGAARGVLGPLLDSAPTLVAIANRDQAKARALAHVYLGPASKLRALGLDDLEDERFDVILNATSAGHQGATLGLPGALVKAASLIYDLAYGEGPAESSTPFLRAARAQGATLTSDGLGMLVEQAALSFFLWRGILPQSQPVLLELRKALSPS